MADYTWNYRLVQFSDGRWGIREFLYDPDGDLAAWFPRSMAPSGGDREELLENLDRYMRSSFLTHLDSDETDDLVRLDEAPSRSYQWKE